MNDDIFYFIAAGILFMAVTVLAWWLARMGKVRSLVFCAGGLVLINAVLLYLSETAEGWDSLDYAIYWALFALPPSVGFVLGGFVGWLLRRLRPQK